MNDKGSIATVTKITVNDAKGRLDRGEPIVFVDARNARAWAESAVKLPGALRVPADSVGAHLPELPAERTLIVYCT